MGFPSRPGSPSTQPRASRGDASPPESRPRLTASASPRASTARSCAAGATVSAGEVACPANGPPSPGDRFHSRACARRAIARATTLSSEASTRCAPAHDRIRRDAIARGRAPGILSWSRRRVARLRNGDNGVIPRFGAPDARLTFRSRLSSDQRRMAHRAFRSGYVVGLRQKHRCHRPAPTSSLYSAGERFRFCAPRRCFRPCQTWRPACVTSTGLAAARLRARSRRGGHRGPSLARSVS